MLLESSYMKKSVLLFLCVMCFAVILSGCNNLGNSGSSSNPTNQIISMEIISAVENEQNIYCILYPYAYYTFNHEKSTVVRNEMMFQIDNETLLEEDFTYIRDYVLGIPEDIGADGENVSFKVILEYYDENGVAQRIYVKGYDSLPDGWSEFVSHVNYVCGEEYLTGQGEILEITPEFLAEVFGVTDADVKEGTLAELIVQNELTILDFAESGYNMRSEINKYYADLKEPLIAPYRPTDLVSVESTEAEYEAFIADYLSNLGEGWEERQSDQNGLRLFCNDEIDDYFYIGRSADINEFNIELPGGNDEYCIFNLDAHMEDMTLHTDYIYSVDSKFILVDCRDTDMMLAFLGVNETEADQSGDLPDLTQYNADLDKMVAVTEEQLNGGMAVDELQLPDYISIKEYAYYDLEPDGDEDLIIQYDISETYPHHVPYDNVLVYGHRVIAIFTNQGSGTWKCVGRNGAIMPDASAMDAHSSVKLEHGKLVIYQNQIGYDNYFIATYHFNGEGFVLEEIRYFITDGKYEDAITYCRIYNYAEQLVCQYTYENKDIDNITSYDWIGSMEEYEITLENSVRIWQQVECDTECTIFENAETYVQDGTFAKLIAN